MWRGTLSAHLFILVVCVAKTLTPPSGAETGFLRIQAWRKRFLPQCRHTRQQNEMRREFLSFDSAMHSVTKGDVQAEEEVQSVAEARKCEVSGFERCEVPFFLVIHFGFFL